MLNIILVLCFLEMNVKYVFPYKMFYECEICFFLYISRNAHQYEENIRLQQNMAILTRDNEILKRKVVRQCNIKFEEEKGTLYLNISTEYSEYVQYHSHYVIFPSL